MMASIFGANMEKIKARRDIYTKSSKFMTTNFLSAPGQIESGGVLHFDHIIFNTSARLGVINFLHLSKYWPFWG